MTVTLDTQTRSASRTWITLAFFLTAALLFVAANRAAYKGYFSDDDLDTLGWSVVIGNDAFVDGILTPRFSESNFRPLGDLYYRYLGRAFKLNYRPFVAVLQALHLLNVALLFLLLRRLDFSQLAAGAGALFYAFHVATLEAYWQPMFIFDVLCGMFCLLTLLLYVRGHWILALIPFWLAYKSKEIAVMLPVALFAFEWLLGERKWKRLVPFFPISLSFGMQALWNNRQVDPGNDYALRFAPDAIRQTIAFYSSTILFVPFAGLALLALPIFVRDRRLYTGVILMVATIAPLLGLPGKLQSVYWYVPMIGLAIMVAAIASRTPSWAIALFFLIWLPLNYAGLREKRRAILTLGDESHWLVTSLQDFASHNPPLRAVVYDSLPPHMHRWGIEGAIHNVFGPHVKATWYQDPDVKEAMTQVPMAMITYYPVEHVVRGMLRTSNVPGGRSYIRFSDRIPSSQFGRGWYDDHVSFRWIEPRAEVTLYRPPEATEFEIVAFVPPDSLLHEGSSKVTVLEDAQSLGTQFLSEPRDQAQPLRWKLPTRTGGIKRITVLTEPVRHGRGDARDYGIAVHAIGYVTP